MTVFCKGWGWARLNENTKGVLSCVLEYHAITAQGRTEVTVQSWEQKLLSKRVAAEFDVSVTYFYSCCLEDFLRWLGVSCKLLSVITALHSSFISFIILSYPFRYDPGPWRFLHLFCNHGREWVLAFWLARDQSSVG